MKIIVTAGPTREHLDPVRFLSNPSTGKMGFALAEAAVKRGHDAVLVAGPVSLKTPAGVKRVDVVSAREMFPSRPCGDYDFHIPRSFFTAFHAALILTIRSLALCTSDSDSPAERIASG